MRKRLVIERTGAVLAEELEIASTCLERTKGLLGRAALAPEAGLALERCAMVHMFFMRFPIDVVFCNREWKVISIVPGLRPWRISPYVNGAYFAVELPCGTVGESGLQKGDRLHLD